MEVILQCLSFVDKLVRAPKINKEKKKPLLLLKITLEACKKLHDLGHKA